LALASASPRVRFQRQVGAVQAHVRDLDAQPARQ
jgi:hypothetical protein